MARRGVNILRDLFAQANKMLSSTAEGTTQDEPTTTLPLASESDPTLTLLESLFSVDFSNASTLDLDQARAADGSDQEQQDPYPF